MKGMMLIRIFYRLWNFWLRLPEQLRFVLIGGFNTLAAYLIFMLCLLLWGEGRYQVCLAAAWVLSSFLSFSLMKIFVFCSTGGWCAEYVKCAASWVMSYAVNALVLELAVAGWQWNVCMAQAFPVVIYTCVTYLLFKYFAFRR